jgi:hypothetical protein
LNEKYQPCHALGSVGKPLMRRGASSFRKMDSLDELEMCGNYT